jgi:CRP/FNR family transcriptional regulator, cyclic AMP receptor protein
VNHPNVYPAGAVLFSERQVSRGVFVLCSGEIKLSMSSIGGKRLILKIAKQGDVIGLIATVTGNPYELTAEALNPCECAFVHRDDFLRFIAKHSEANGEVVSQMCSSYVDACERLRTLVLSASAPEKLACWNGPLKDRTAVRPGESNFV